MIEANSNLPVGWVRLNLGSVCSLGSARIQPEDAGNVPCVGLENIVRDKHVIEGFGAASESRSIKSKFEEGDILYGRLRPNLNKVAIAAFDGICSTDILVIRPLMAVRAEFLLEVLACSDFVEYAKSLAKGINLPRVSAQDLMAYEVLVPPLEEQVRIVSALAEYRRSLGATGVGLASLAKTLAYLPSAILSAAVRGEIGGGGVRRSAMSNAATSHINEDVRVPSDWRVEKVGDAGLVRTGIARTPQRHSGNNMRPYLRVANVFEDRIDISDVMEMNISDAELERYQLVNGDILLNEGQSIELVGRPAIFRGEMGSVCFTNSLVQFRCGNDILPEFAILVFRHYLRAGVFRRIAKITTNLAHLGASRFASLDFPLPSVEEQAEISKLAHAHLNKVSDLMIRVRSMEALVESIDDALVRLALSGKLVQQSDSDNTQCESAPELEPSGASVDRVRRAQKNVKGGRVRQIVPVVEALLSAAGELSAHELFSASGYPDDSSSELVERFYLELRAGVLSGQISCRKSAEEDFFRPGRGSIED